MKQIESLKKQLDDSTAQKADEIAQKENEIAQKEDEIAQRQDEIRILNALYERQKSNYEAKLQAYEDDKKRFQLRQEQLEEQIKGRSCAIM